MFPVSRLGTVVSPAGNVRFGILLPWISPRQGYKVTVHVVPSNNACDTVRQPTTLGLEHAIDQEYGDYWRGELSVAKMADLGHDLGRLPSLRFNYYYTVHSPNGRGVGPVLDPFARESGPGLCSSFAVGECRYRWGSYERKWNLPRLNDLVVYELLLPSFEPNLNGVEEKLDYLVSLGVNALQIAPVVQSAMPADYLPLSHVAIDRRLGRAADLKRLVEQSHLRGMAVILDVVYAHTGRMFPYYHLYRELGFRENPVMGSFAKDDFGESMDFRRRFTRDYCLAANRIWLEEFHVDGFRYDCVPGYWDGPTGDGFAALAYRTNQIVCAEMRGKGGRRHWNRFRGASSNRLIQCAEALDQPEDVLSSTSANCVWQTRTMDSARSFATRNPGSHTDFGLRLGAWGFPSIARHGKVDVPKTVIHYLESHDNARFATFLGSPGGGPPELDFAHCRQAWRRLRPYLVALFTAKGVPMIWQGQELGVVDSAAELQGRHSTNIHPIDWSLAVDSIGQELRRFVALLARLRRTLPELRDGRHFFHNESDCDPDVILQSRQFGNRCCVIALNFAEVERKVCLRFPLAGVYVDALACGRRSMEVKSDGTTGLVIPAQYACVWVRQAKVRGRVRSCRE